MKGSELEKNTDARITTTRMSRALAIFKEMQDESLELPRIQKSTNDLNDQREKRHAFTYRMNRAAQISEAKISVAKAAEFRELIEEYILARK